MNQVTEKQVMDSLREVVDPEINCNVVDLGLIYNTDISEGRVTVQMTLTTPGCPMHESIALAVEHALLGIDGVTEAHAEVVWDPPWEPSMMTEAGRARVGLA